MYKDYSALSTNINKENNIIDIYGIENKFPLNRWRNATSMWDEQDIYTEILILIYVHLVCDDMGWCHWIRISQESIDKIFTHTKVRVKSNPI